MKNPRWSILWALLLGGALPIVAGVALRNAWSGIRWANLPLHSLSESLGLFAGIILALLLIIQQNRLKTGLSYIWIASALIGMGVLDGFHAAAAVGDGFVWLHGIAIVFGGLLFAAAWWPARAVKSQAVMILPAAAAVSAIALGALAFADPRTVPAMLVSGVFTPAASAVNMTGGILFVIGAMYFFVKYWTSRNTEDILFAFFGLLNGSVGALFLFSAPWTVIWWGWHVLRSVSYLVVLGNVFVSFRRSQVEITDLQEAEARLQKALLENSRQRERLEEVFAAVSSSATVLAVSAQQLAASSNQLATATAETATAVSETSSTMAELRQASLLSSSMAKSVSVNAQETEQIARQGSDAMQALAVGITNIKERMAFIAGSTIKLKEQNQAIDEVVATVNDIADQSNLLAVNAAIEAAKAGDWGRGFTVVAQEIKSLADRSKQATARARTVLAEVQRGANSAVAATEQGNEAVHAALEQSAQADQSIRTLTGSVVEAKQATTHIFASSQQQLAGIDQVASAAESIREASNQNAASTAQIERAAQGLQRMSQELKGLLQR